MAKIEQIDGGVVYRNPNPGYEYSFACHSYLIELAPNELLCTFQRGQALYSVDSIGLRSRSRDGGKTWQYEGPLHDPSKDRIRHSYHGPMVTRLRDGTLMVTEMRIDRTDPKKPLFNEATGGLAPA